MTRGIALTLLLLLATPCRAEDAPAVTSDTLAYCRDLAHRVTERHSAVPDVQKLLAEGRDMCERGELRGGIRRIRRALVMLKHRTVTRAEEARQ